MQRFLHPLRQSSDARNWAFGCWAEFEGDAIWRSSNESVKPDSLYLAQLTDRLGRDTHHE